MSLNHRSDTFFHLLDPGAEKTLLVEVVVWVLFRLHRRVHELLHGYADDLIGDLVVVAAELLESCLSIAAGLASSSYFWTQRAASSSTRRYSMV